MRKVALAIVLVAVADLLWVVASTFQTIVAGYPRGAATWSRDGSASVLQFGFDALRSGSAPAAFASQGYTARKAWYPRKARAAARPAPLYVNGFRDRHPPFTDRHVLIFGIKGRGEIRAWDMANDTIVWRVTGLPGSLAGTPLLDLQRGRIYFTTVKWQRHDDADPALTDLLTPHWAHSVDLHGERLTTVPVDLARLLQHRHGDFAIDPAAAIQCKTAIGISRAVEPAYIHFGCAPSTAPYGFAKGIRGALVRVFLQPSGDLQDDGIEVFTPSEPTALPLTGYDTGIWNSGSGPATLDDGAILVATGNGPYLPERHNFGCSVLRLEAASFRVAAARGPDAFDHYSNGDGVYDECWGANLDMASSSVAVLRKDARYYAAITGKDGRLRVFDPYRMPGHRAERKRETTVAHSAWGQPAIWADPDGRVRVAALGSDPPTRREKADYVVGTPESISRMPGSFAALECLGHVPERPAADTIRLALYYSGPRRDNYAAAAAGDGPPPDRKFPRDFTPYRYQFDVARLYRDASGEPPPGFVFEALGLYSRLDQGYSYAASVPPFSATAGVFAARFGKSGAGHVEDSGYLLVRADGSGCGESAPPEHRPLTLYRREAAGEPAAIYGGFAVAPDHAIETRWLRTLPAGIEHAHSSPAVILDPQGQKPPLMLFAAYENTRDGQQSYLFVVDADAGEVIDRIPFRGFSSFTMPVVAGRQVLLSTVADGIVLFADRLGQGEEIWHRSVLLRLARGLIDALR